MFHFGALNHNTSKYVFILNIYSVSIVSKQYDLTFRNSDVISTPSIYKVRQSVEAMRTLVEQSEDMHDATQHHLKTLLEQTTSITERNTTVRLKVEDIQRTIITMQEQIDENRRQIVRLSEEQTKQKEKQTEHRQEIKQDISIIYRRHDDLTEEQTMLKERQKDVRQEIGAIRQRQNDLSEEQTKLTGKQAEDRQETDFLRQRQERLSKAVEEITGKNKPHIPSEKGNTDILCILPNFVFFVVQYRRAVL